jgi:hypothetical protein
VDIRRYLAVVYDDDGGGKKGGGCEQKGFQVDDGDDVLKALSY